MAINLSHLLTRIKIDLGVYGLVLPFENPDKELADVIKNVTLTTFSNFFPDICRKSLDLKTLIPVQELYQESIYILPDIFGTREILSIRRINPRSMLLSGGYYAPYIDSTPELYMGMMMAQANADLISAAAPAFTFKFQAPNRLYLYNITTMYGMLDIDFNLTHAENLSTVKKSMYDTFYKIAIMDMKNFLYGALKHYKNIQTAYGTITLEIDEWAGAANEREDLIERFRDVYHLEQDALYII
jgi:hypothetical protein